VLSGFHGHGRTETGSTYAQAHAHAHAIFIQPVKESGNFSIKINLRQPCLLSCARRPFDGQVYYDVFPSEGCLVQPPEPPSALTLILLFRSKQFMPRSDQCGSRSRSRSHFHASFIATFTFTFTYTNFILSKTNQPNIESRCLIWQLNTDAGWQGAQVRETMDRECLVTVFEETRPSFFEYSPTLKVRFTLPLSLSQSSESATVSGLPETARCVRMRPSGTLIRHQL
jgi:hypothetical protein